uniref:Peptidase M13 C-terminal domain-containing protein n=1 Tax=Bracon brevicornis TaxID=1563983 RepID=A0A6V7LG42_9HYME
MWCLSAADSYFKNEAPLDEHSPGNIRIVGSTANFDEFSKAFNCPAGTPLNPTNKCNI